MKKNHTQANKLPLNTDNNNTRATHKAHHLKGSDAMFHMTFCGVNRTEQDSNGRYTATITTPLYHEEYHTEETEGNLIGHVPTITDRVLHGGSHVYGERTLDAERYHIIETLARLEPNTNRNLVDARKMLQDRMQQYVTTLRRNAADEWYADGLYALPEHTIHDAIRRTNQYGTNMAYIYDAEKQLILEEVALNNPTAIYNAYDRYGLLFHLVNRSY